MQDQSIHHRWVLPVIVIAQFCCTSLWFAGNAVIDDLVPYFDLPPGSLGHLTSVVQLGFISGTLVFAVLTISDRHSPSLVFFVSAVAGSLFNIAVIFGWNTFVTLLIFRFLTGFFLAGIYPVGMKIASDYARKGLGKSLGYLVGALVVGTAFPHLLNGFSIDLPWRMVFVITSALALFGGLAIWLLVADGPYRKPSQKFDLSSFVRVFRNKPFRAAAFGYFGHMWELYAFWAFVPLMLLTYNRIHPGVMLNVPLLSFFIIGLGGLACVAGGYISLKKGARKTAFTALLLSGLCCLVSPLAFSAGSPAVFAGFLIFWGLVVIADSPLFSTLVAQHAQPEVRGTALTIVNCIGFAITIVSIQLLVLLQRIFSVDTLFMILAIGPLFGLIALGFPSRRKQNSQLKALHHK